MEIGKILGLAKDEIVNKFIQFLFMTLIFGIGIFLFGCSIFLYSSSSFYRDVSNESLSHRNKGTYYFSLPVLTTKHYMGNKIDSDFYEKIKRIDGIENCGYFEFGTIDGLDEIKNIQKKTPYRSEQDGLQYMFANYQATGMLNIRLENGGEIEKPKNRGTEYIYLGYKLKSIPIGSEYYYDKYVLDDEGALSQVKTKVIVKGYIEKGCNVVNSNVIYRNKILNTNYYCMDYLPLLVTNDDHLDVYDDIYLFYNIKQGFSNQEIKDKINEIAYENGITLVYSDFEEAFHSRESKKMRLYSYLSQLAFVILVTVAILQICMQSISIITNSKKYGIMYANGVTKKDLRWIIISQSFIKYIFSICIVIFGAAGLYYFIKPETNDMLMVSNYIYCIKHFVLLKTFVISVVVMAIGTAVPLYIINRMQPVELIKSGQ